MPSLTPRPLRVLIADDEPLARGRMRSLLLQEPGTCVVAEAANGSETIAAIERIEVDLILLDIQMPEMDGFATVEAMRTGPAAPAPAIIFVTAYDAYALQAFAVHAVDYLLKPVSAERLHEAVHRVHVNHDVLRLNHDLRSRMSSLRLELETLRHARQQLLVKTDGEITLLALDDIDWISSAGNYVTLHIKGRTKLWRETLQAVEKRLAPHRFARISRSTLVNTTKIATLRSAGYGDYCVRLQDTTELALSRAYREAFLSTLNQI